MPAPAVPKISRAEAPVAANTQLRAAALPEPPKDGGTKVPTTSKALNPKDFVRIQPLPALAEREGKVLARSWALYRSSGPPSEQVCWEKWHRRERQRTQGLFTPRGKPYQELGELLCTDPKQLTLRSLGQLAQEPVKKDVQERPQGEVAEVTADESSVNPKSDPLESVKRLTSSKETGKELKTLSKTLAHLRHHISIVKQGGEYFHILHQESLEQKKALKAQKSQVTRWRTDFQPSKYSSEVEVSDEEMNTSSPIEGSHPKKSGKKKKKVTLRSYTPIYTSVLISRPSEAQSGCVFRQLCAIHWLLEALTLESSSSMHSILSCWNLTDPGGFKKSVKEIEEEKFATYMWELFITNTKKYMRKARRIPFRRQTNKAAAPASSQLSSHSSHGPTPLSSVNSLVLYSEDNINLSGALPNVSSVSMQTKEQQFFPYYFSPAPQKQTQRTDVKASKDVQEQADMLTKTGLQSCHISHFIKSKSNLCADTRHQFMAIREEAAQCLHDALESLERSQEERCCKKYMALKQLKYFKKDMERIRQLDVRAERERDENGLKWFPALLAKLPEPVKNDHYVKKILKKLEKFGMAPDLHIDQDTFLKAVTDLQPWELCSPDIAAAVEFVRESIVQMPEEDFSEWFQARVDPLHAQSSTFNQMDS
ncbi:coiled-coil domain-containing protein 60 isoform X2 [Phasianus colchicus]|uniref:coiled-coil domain-containing protein 60 isoform X2 n=1 Tax=Phasianus colchicus TaxID=9054 RepID=UPI00129EA675|nr:coiled-coil domain-containing protein 60 isoform X2 [Phasianus colchicus]